MKLIAGLGNPGRKYEETRHNIGFEVVREVARRHATSGTKVKFQGEVCEAQISGGGESALLLLPQTFMNRSGNSVLPARDFYKIDHEDILIICDDFNLALGRLRFRPKGSAGGQNGLANILQRLGDQEIPRLRIGVGKPPPEWDVADYVLSKFRKDEIDSVQIAIQHAADAVAVWVRSGMAECMNKYNADPTKKNVKKAKKPKSKNEKSSDSTDEALAEHKRQTDRENQGDDDANKEP